MVCQRRRFSHGAHHPPYESIIEFRHPRPLEDSVPYIDELFRNGVRTALEQNPEPLA